MEGFSTLSEAELRRILGGVEKLPDTVAGHDERLDNHDTLLANHEGRITTLEAAIITPPDLTALTAHETRLDGHDADISAIQVTLGGLPDFAAHETRLDGHDTDIIAIQTTLGGLPDFGVIETRLDGHDAAVSTLSTRADNHDLADTALDGRLDVLEARYHPLIVTTEAELLAAMGAARQVFIRGLIALSSTLVITTNGLQLIADGEGSGLLMQHDAAGVTPRIVVRIQAAKVTLSGLTITSNHPLTSHTTINDIGIDMAVDSTVISGLRILGCKIHHVMHCITRLAGAGASIAEDIRIENTEMVSFGRYGVYVQARARGGRLTRCRIFGREYGETHAQVGNGVWWGNFGDYFEMVGNEIAFCGRHGVEFWNSQDSPVNTDGNFDAMLVNNRIHDMLNAPESFGISAFGNGVIGIYNNKVAGCTLGIETYGDKTNLAFIHCIGNAVTEWGHNTFNAQAFSINGVRGGKYSQNYIGPPAGLLTHNNTRGMEVWNGGSDIEITDNRFHDAGVVNLMVNGKALTITGISQAADGVFTTSATIDTSVNNGWAVGKRIYLTGIGGMTALNGKYYTITFVSGTQFRVGVNTSAMAAYTSGGRVLERWDNITIDNNKFRRSVVPGVSGNTEFKSPLWVFEIQNAIITNNRSWVKSGLGLSTFAISDWGTVYIGPTDATTVTAASPSDLFVLGSTNIEVAFAT